MTRCYYCGEEITQNQKVYRTKIKSGSHPYRNFHNGNGLNDEPVCIVKYLWHGSPKKTLEKNGVEV